MSEKSSEKSSAKNTPTTPSNPNITELTTLMELMKSFDVTHLEIDDGEKAIKLSRGHAVASAPASFQMLAAPAHTAAPVAAVAENTETALTGHALRSPMVGTVYLSPSPEADNFVKVGQSVSVGDVLCLVEAMKMFNQIEADKAGVVKACLVKSGDPVEFDHPLFIIE